MSFDFTSLLILLLPVAAASGWWMARRKPRKMVVPSSVAMHQDYLRGLNFLVNEDADKAIEVFLQLSEVDNDAVETHLALGSLYRRRGEVDRALRIHQNLIARPNLNKAHRQQAAVELGKDYLHAGVLDRAESLFLELTEGGAYMADALKWLITIYEKERDWPNAIKMSEKLQANSQQRLAMPIAHYYCELAEQALRQGETKQARQHLRKATQVEPDCIRAHLILGDLTYQQAEYRSAAKTYRRVLEQNPDYTAEVIERLLECHQQLGRVNELKMVLEETAMRYDGVAPFITLAYLAYAADDPDQAESYLAQYLGRTPDLAGISRIAYALSQLGDPAFDQLLLSHLRGAQGKLLKIAATHHCQQCGFDGRHLHWQCPSCATWNSIVPYKHAPVKLPLTALQSPGNPVHA